MSEQVKLNDENSKSWKDLLKREVKRYIGNFESLSNEEKSQIIEKGITRKLSETYNTVELKEVAIAEDKLDLKKSTSKKLTKGDISIVNKIKKNAGEDNELAKQAIILTIGEDKYKEYLKKEEK